MEESSNNAGRGQERGKGRSARGKRGVAARSVGFIDNNDSDSQSQTYFSDRALMPGEEEGGMEYREAIVEFVLQEMTDKQVYSLNYLDLVKLLF